jgi:hypothetical protein
MDQVVPWTDLVELIAPCYLEGKKGSPLFSLQTMLHINSCINASPCRSQAWKKPSLTDRFTMSLQSLKNLVAYQNRAPSCLSVTSLKSIIETPEVQGERISFAFDGAAR